MNGHDVPDRIIREVGWLRLSRRSFLALAGTSLITGCSLLPQSSPSTANRPTKTVTSTLLPIGSITLENVNRVKQLAELDTGGFTVRSVAWSPDAKTVAAGAYSRVQLWDAVKGRIVTSLTGHTGQINGLAWSRDGRALASVSDDGTIRLWDMHTFTLIKTWQGTSGSNLILSVAWSPNGKELVTGDSVGVVRVWDSSNYKKLAEWTGSATSNLNARPFPLAVWGVAWSPDGALIASGRYDGIVQLWNASTGKQVAVLYTSSKPNGVAWSPDGMTLATTDDDGVVQLWNRGGKNLTTLSAPDVSGWSFPVTWSLDGNILADAGEDGLVRLWNVQTRKELVALAGHTAQVRGLAWSPDGLRIVSGSDDTTIRLWGVQ